MESCQISKVKDLEIPDVERVFHLAEYHNTDWSQFRATFEFPDSTKQMLQLIDDQAPYSDAALRMRLATLLVSVHSTPPAIGLPQIPISGPDRFSFGPIIHQDEKHDLRGFSNFCICYKPDTHENVAVNFVIVETEKKQGCRGIPQVPAYMGRLFPLICSSDDAHYPLYPLGMIRAQRYEYGMAPHIIFGLSTDYEQFHFVRMNGDGQWSRLSINYSYRQEIAEILLYIHAQASELSISEEADADESGQVWSVDNIFRREEKLPCGSLYEDEDTRKDSDEEDWDDD